MKSVALVTFAAAITSLLAGCGPSPAERPANAPVQVVRVPADRVVEKCPCNGDDDDDEVEAAPPPRKTVEYVRMDEWVPPPGVQATEARIEPRGNKPPDLVKFPELTLHQGIPVGRAYGRYRYWR